MPAPDSPSGPASAEPDFLPPIENSSAPASTAGPAEWSFGATFQRAVRRVSLGQLILAAFGIGFAVTAVILTTTFFIAGRDKSDAATGLGMGLGIGGVFLIFPAVLFGTRLIAVVSRQIIGDDLQPPPRHPPGQSIYVLFGVVMVAPALIVNVVAFLVADSLVGISAVCIAWLVNPIALTGLAFAPLLVTEQPRIKTGDLWRKSFALTRQAGFFRLWGTWIVLLMLASILAVWLWYPAISGAKQGETNITLALAAGITVLPAGVVWQAMIATLWLDLRPRPLAVVAPPAHSHYG